MKNEGFIPLTAVGLIFLLLSLSFVGYYHWKSHHTKMNSITRTADSSLVSSVEAKRNDLSRQALESVYNSLWKVCENTNKHGNVENQEQKAENLAETRFEKRLQLILDNSKAVPSSPRLVGNGIDSNFNFRRAGNGYVMADVRLPTGTSALGTLPDNSFSVKLPCDNLFTSVDSRFYLLQDRMKKFEDRLGQVGKRWKFAEYAFAYIGAWLKGEVTLNKNRSKGLFQLALASHEIGNFGSTDYRAIVGDLSRFPETGKLVDGFNSESMVDPLKEDDIQVLINRIDNSLKKIKDSSLELRRAGSSVEELENFEPQKWFDKRTEEFSELEKKIDSGDSKDLKREFGRICSKFESVYALPSRILNEAISEIQKSKELATDAQAKFERCLDYIKKLSQSSPFMKELYDDMTGGENTPSLAEQVDSGVDGVLENLSSLEEKARDLRSSFKSSSEYTRIFPSTHLRRFRNALEENDRESAKEIFSNAWDSAEQSFESFEKDIEGSSERIHLLEKRFSMEFDAQDEEPDANWRKTYTEYPDPGEDPEEEPEGKVAEKYVIYSGKGSLAGIEKILKNARADLVSLQDLNKDFEEEQDDLKRFDIDEDLKEYLEKGLEPRNLQNISREKSYELSPPVPLKSNPGISVYHELDIEDVVYDREDPLGLVYDSAPPTPIYLWFIDTIVYWAQWNVRIKIEEPIVEKIFDYRNQTIPRPVFGDSKRYIHKALPYYREFRKSEFSFRLVVLSLRKFSISTG